MKRSLLHFSLFGALVAFALSTIACGGPPPLEEIEKNLDAPSLEVSGGMIAKSYLSYDRGAVAVNMPVMGAHGKMISFLKADPNRKDNVLPMRTYLRQSGLPAVVVEQIMQRLPIHDDMTAKKNATVKGEFGVLKQAQTACVDGRLAGLDGSFAITVDLGCLGQGSGRVSMHATPLFSVFDLAKKLTFRLEVRFDKACDGKGNCVDGAMLYKVGIVTGSEQKGVRLMLSMLLKVTSADGAELQVKQGIRVSLDAARGKTSNRVEVVTYVKDEENREFTVVLGLDNADKLGTFAVRGANGSYVCKTADRGRSGSCHAKGKEGTVAYKW